MAYSLHTGLSKSMRVFIFPSAGEAGCWASPVCRCAASCSATFAQWTVGASRHPAFPAPSAFLRAKNTAKLGRDVPRGGEDVSTIQKRVGGEQRCCSLRHCEH